MEPVDLWGDRLRWLESAPERLRQLESEVFASNRPEPERNKRSGMPAHIVYDEGERTCTGPGTSR